MKEKKILITAFWERIKFSDKSIKLHKTEFLITSLPIPLPSHSFAPINKYESSFPYRKISLDYLPSYPYPPHCFNLQFSFSFFFFSYIFWVFVWCVLTWRDARNWYNKNTHSKTKNKSHGFQHQRQQTACQSISIMPDEEEVRKSLGEGITMTCTATGEPKPNTLRWFDIYNNEISETSRQSTLPR